MRKGVVLFLVWSTLVGSSVLYYLGFTDVRPLVFSLVGLLPLLRFRIPLNAVTLGLGALTLISAASTLLNHTALFGLVLFLRTVGGTFLIYLAVTDGLTPALAPRVMRLLAWLSYFQGPLVIFERLYYSNLPQHIRHSIALVDIGSGSFPVKSDYALASFLLLLLAVALLSPRLPLSSAHRRAIMINSSAVVLLTNSQLSHIVLIFVWFVYLARLRPRTLAIALPVSFLLTFGLIFTGAAAPVLARFTDAISRLHLDYSRAGYRRFLRGQYAHGAAFAYYASHAVKILGDGPGTYFNPLTDRFRLGIQGHLLTFYSEVGLLGLLASYYIFLRMALPKVRRAGSNLLPALVCFAIAMAMSLTGLIMSNIAFLVSYVVLTRIAYVSAELYDA